MVKIIKTLDNRWGIVAPTCGVVMDPAGFEEMTDQAHAMGVRPDALEMALEDMKKTGNNVAHFGMGIQENNFGTYGFIFSDKAEIIERVQGIAAGMRLGPTLTQLPVELGLSPEGNA